MFISTVVCLVPVVDCSDAVGVVEMTEVFVDIKCKINKWSSLIMYAVFLASFDMIVFVHISFDFS